MAELRNVQYQAGAGARTYDASIDEGLRSYMIRVYNLMALAMGITALFAAGTVMLATTNNPAAAAASLPNGTMLTALGTVIYGSPLRWVIMLAPLALAAGVGASASISCRSVRLSAATFNSGGRPCACGGAHCRPTSAGRWRLVPRSQEKASAAITS